MASDALSSDKTSSLIDKFASDQVKSLAKKLNLSSSQQEQVTSLVTNTLKSDKFKSMLGDLDPSALLGSSKKKEEVQKALMDDEGFNKGMDKILDDDQKKKLKSE
ncbi:MAG: hypothetical protein HRU26_17185 [Psychroserpens sp.]|nr:hypothetical protein [Psychroserpens sp.]